MQTLQAEFVKNMESVGTAGSAAPAKPAAKKAAAKKAPAKPAAKKRTRGAP
jgi:hypothetical protein